MQQAGRLTAMGPPAPLQVKDGKASVQTSLPRQGVALFVIEPG
jgi:hypothetical protein